MLLEHILGIGIIAVAYCALWYLVLYSRRIIDRIDEGGLGRLREIKRELGLKKEKDG